MTISDGSSYGVQSCNWDGGDLRQVVQLQDGATPLGILVHDERIYWASIRNDDGKLRSSTKEGKDVRTHYETFEKFRHLTIGEDIGDYPGASQALKPLRTAIFASSLLVLVQVAAFARTVGH